MEVTRYSWIEYIIAVGRKHKARHLELCPSKNAVILHTYRTRAVETKEEIEGLLNYWGIGGIKRVTIEPSIINLVAVVCVLEHEGIVKEYEERDK